MHLARLYLLGPTGGTFYNQLRHVNDIEHMIAISPATNINLEISSLRNLRIGVLPLRIDGFKIVDAWDGSRLRYVVCTCVGSAYNMQSASQRHVWCSHLYVQVLSQPMTHQLLDIIVDSCPNLESLGLQVPYLYNASGQSLDARCLSRLSHLKSLQLPVYPTSKHGDVCTNCDCRRLTRCVRVV
jgi:hypothetical protein